MLIKSTLVLFLLVSLGGCSMANEESNTPTMKLPKYDGEKMLKTKVVNMWQAGQETIIQVQTPSGDYLEIKNYYFGSTSPKIGDCILIWASIYSGGHPSFYNQEVLHNDRDIAPCKN